jgi:hypothetical protein
MTAVEQGNGLIQECTSARWALMRAGGRLKAIFSEMGGGRLSEHGR